MKLSTLVFVWMMITFAGTFYFVNHHLEMYTLGFMLLVWLGSFSCGAVWILSYSLFLKNDNDGIIG